MKALETASAETTEPDSIPFVADIMVAITLPDGSVRKFDSPVSGAELAASIGPGLAKAALALVVDGEGKDLAHVIDGDAAVAIVTRDGEEALELLRHDAAHVMAEAVQELVSRRAGDIRPGHRGRILLRLLSRGALYAGRSAEDRKAHAEIVDRDEAITREVWDRDEAIRFFKDKGEHFKAEHIETLPHDADISIYRQGDWLDLCIGPHLPSTGKLGKAFKLMKLSGAYWRGDARNTQLQRIYGTAWRTEKELKAYLHRLEEAEKRDHRRLGREMDLFHIQEEAAGSIFWHRRAGRSTAPARTICAGGWRRPIISR